MPNPYVVGDASVTVYRFDGALTTDPVTISAAGTLPVSAGLVTDVVVSATVHI